MWDVGGRAKSLVGLLLVVSLAILLVIVTLPRLSSYPRHIFASGVLSAAATQLFIGRSSTETDNNAAAQWGRLATFFIITGRRDVQNMSAQLAEAAGDCRSLPSDGGAFVCRTRADIYLLYADYDDLTIAEAARNATRYI